MTRQNTRVSRTQPTADALPDLSFIAEDLRALAVPVASLNPAPNNARRHDLGKDIPVLKESLRRFGQRKAVVGKREYQGVMNAIIAGNGTLLAASELGWSHLAVSWFEGTDEDASEFALVDNRSAELSEWNLEELSVQLRAIQERGGSAEHLASLGWNEHEAAPLIAARWQPGQAVGGGLPGREVHWRSVSLSLGQWLVLELAIQRMQRQEGDPSMPEGRALELLAAEFLGGGDPAQIAEDRHASE